ncbi:MAG: c-type cytochrome [Burkholderiales bacterium]|nr:c-type cytochrome [Burkholderiales bacterium]
MTRNSGSTAWVLAALVAWGPALAQSDQHKVRQWAASCAACHGTEGRSEGGMPPIAGRKADELYTLMLAFKSGERPATVMHQHAKGYSDGELRQISEYFSRVKP